MSTAADQGRARSALTYLAQVLRPDWDPPGIIAAVEALHRDRQPLGLIARATISAALTPSTKTPGGIAARIRAGFDGAETPTATPTAPHVSSLRCDSCGGIKPEGDEEHARICARLSGPTDSYREARAALAATTDTEEQP